MPPQAAFSSVKGPAGLALGLTALLTGVMLWGNLHVQKASVLDKAILNPNDPYLVSDREVRSLAPQGVGAGDLVSFVLPLPNGPNVSSLALVRKLTERLEQNFPECGVLSLSKAVNYRDTGRELLGERYVNDSLIAELGNDHSGERQAKWKEDVKRHEGVYGVLIGKEFDFTQILMWMPPSAGEMEMARRVASLLEGRSVTSWSEYLRTDFSPQGDWAAVLPAGWFAGRYVIVLTLFRDIMVLSAVGLLLTFVCSYLSFRSLRQALITTVVVLLTFVWTRGSLGWLQQAGFELYERIYFLLVFTSMIVASLSFCLHQFTAYNQARLRHPELDRLQVWRQVRGIRVAVLVTALVAFLNFTALYQIRVRGILEVGVLSATGIVWAVFLALWFLPAAHNLVGGDSAQDGWQDWPWLRQLGLGWTRVLERLVGGCLAFQQSSGRTSTRLRARTSWVLSLTVLLCLVAGALVVSGYLQITTRPLEFIAGTTVERASRILNREHGYGFDRVSLVVTPKGGNPSGESVYDPVFLERAKALQETLATVPGARIVTSVLDSVSVISRESYQRPTPETSQEAYDILEHLLANDLGPAVKQQLWYANGIVLYASLSADDSNAAGIFCDRLLAQAANFPDLQVRAFGTFPLYARVDQYIRQGKPLNALSGLWIVVAIGAAWVGWRNRRGQLGGVLRPCRTGLVLSVPFVFASAVIAIVMMGLRVPLDHATACITALAINAAIDFSLYLVADFQDGLLAGQESSPAMLGALQQKGKVILLDIILNSICFLPLTFSHFLPVSRMGWLMIVMLLASGVGALIVLPALLPWCVRRPPSSRTYPGRVAQDSQSRHRRAPTGRAWKRLGGAAVLACLPVHAFPAEPLTGRQVIEITWQRYRQSVLDEWEHAQVEVVYRGKVEQKELTRWIHYGTNREDRIAISFTKPARDRIKALIYRHPGGRDEQWLKLPSLPSPRRVSLSDHTFFAGTDLVYEDLRQLVGEQTTDFEYRLAESQQESGRWVHVVEATPRPGVKSAYRKRLFTIEREQLAILRIQYFGEAGLIKTQTSREVTVDQAGRWRVGAVEIENHHLSRRTNLRFVNRQINPGVPESVFDVSFLTSERY